MKKLPPKKFRREIFSEKLGQLVHLQSHGALLACSIVLVQQTLDDSLVNGLNSLLVSSLSGSLVACNQSSIELLQVGLQLRLVGLVLLVSNLGRNDILLGGLNVGHCCISFLGIFIQLHIIAPFGVKINPLFQKFFLPRRPSAAFWRTGVFHRKAQILSPSAPEPLSRPKNLHKIYTVVKFTESEKVVNPSKGVASFYVNPKMDIHSPAALWKTPVDKVVDNVENSGLSTGILIFSPGCPPPFPNAYSHA